MHQLGASRALVIVLLTVALLAPAASTVQAAPGGPAGAGGPTQRFVVVMRDGAGNPRQLAEQVGRDYQGRAGLVFEHLLRGFAIELPPAAAEALRHHPQVAYVEPDFVFHKAGEVPPGVRRVNADKNPTAGIDGRDTRVDVDIAILDTGIAAHGDLNIAGGVNCTGISCVSGNFGDGDGHGTHVAGTAAALDNGVGVVGVAPGARLWGVKVLGDDGSGYLSWIVAGLDWAAGRGDIEVVNMSLGCECSSRSLNDALTRATNAGMVVVAAAGNNGKDAATFSPANHPNVIAVSAIADFDGQPGGLAAATCSSGGADDALARFSNYGRVVDLAAPGVCIRSTLPGGGYGMMSGTSMAAPHVAGAAALFVVEKGIGRSGSRWSTVRDGLRAQWSVAQSDPCGFTGGKSAEPLLMVAPCGTAAPAPAPSTGAISGTVTNASTGAAISGAQVTVANTSLSATTASDGSFTISGVQPGTHTVTAAASGFESRDASVAVEAGATASLSLALTPGSTRSTETLAVSVQPNRSSYRLGETAAITVRVTAGGAAVSGASVRLTIRGTSGRVTSMTRTTGSNGTATFSFRTSLTFGRGTYTATADASRDGYTSGSASTSFTVR